MTKIEFMMICATLLIDPDVALENEELQSALKERNDAEVKRILEEEF